MSEWVIEGTDLFIQNWDTNEELSANQANERLNEFDELQKQNSILRRDLAGWLQLARRQYNEMEHNHPICPTANGIAQTEKLLGL